MELAAVYDAFTRNAPSEDSERVYVIAREKGKHRNRTAERKRKQ